MLVLLNHSGWLAPRVVEETVLAEPKLTLPLNKVSVCVGG